ncbi:uncharacterized protein LOC112573309 [Pomacea canaliculata]|uniref:uncharacterized protein LOC112573309 n=1 Tax=Pomacea canaliculata TaxID=400727 RepID=UPI000D731702|nr:uncharacterized protein LOC112573309 [Pomacea canaliculata]
MCTRHGVQCSSSDCDGLVKKVAPCPLVGQRWSDGCYKCRCRRNGITCRLDATCHHLHHHPVPCLADERCICGPDGVPSCTAEVIDRRAFSAHRLDLRFPDVTYEFVRAQEGGHHKALKKAEKHGDISISGKEDLTGFQDSQKEDTSQELLIMSDNLCRLGSRWYGGSLRCFCDVDGAITCGDPAVVTAFIDNFSVQRNGL